MHIGNADISDIKSIVDSMKTYGYSIPHQELVKACLNNEILVVREDKAVVGILGYSSSVNVLTGDVRVKVNLLIADSKEVLRALLVSGIGRCKQVEYSLKVTKYLQEKYGLNSEALVGLNDKYSDCFEEVVHETEGYRFSKLVPVDRERVEQLFDEYLKEMGIDSDGRTVVSMYLASGRYCVVTCKEVKTESVVGFIVVRRGYRYYEELTDCMYVEDMYISKEHRVVGATKGMMTCMFKMAEMVGSWIEGTTLAGSNNIGNGDKVGAVEKATVFRVEKDVITNKLRGR